MTKAEQPTIDSIIQDICELDNNPFEGMGDDDVWCSLSDLRVILERNFEDHRTTSLAAQDGLVKHMANRFLGWKLPENFHPDNGISFKPTFNDHMDPPMRHNPIGTNLFNATQAEEMVRYMLEGYDQ